MNHSKSLVPAILLFCLAGCGVETSTAAYRVMTAQDGFTQTVDGKTISFANWQLSVEGKEIDVPHVESTIIVRCQGGRTSVDVNGKTVYSK